MIWFLARRLTIALATLLLASLVVFLLLEILPGDPALLILGVNAQEDTLAALRAQMGLDQPGWWRYLAWLGELARADLGESATYSTPVRRLIADRIDLTVPLALLAMTLSVAIALPVGVIAAARRGGPIDTTLMGLSQLGVAVPNFWFALLLIMLFAVALGWLPSGGFAGWDAGLAAALASLAMPALALALPQAAILARVARSAMLETLGEDYIRTARAKGLSRGQAIRRHGLKNAMIPVVTIMGLQFSFLLSGTIIIENVFYLPGIGRLLFQAIAQRDLIVVKNLIMLLAALVITINVLVDLTYAWLDPRLRTG